VSNKFFLRYRKFSGYRPIGRATGKSHLRSVHGLFSGKFIHAFMWQSTKSHKCNEKNKTPKERKTNAMLKNKKNNWEFRNSTNWCELRIRDEYWIWSRL